MRRLLALLFASLWLAPQAWAGFTVAFDSLRVGQIDDRFNLVLDLSGPSQAKYFTLTKPDRFVVDLLNTRLIGKKPFLDYAGTPVKKLRTGKRKGGDLRLVIDLQQSVQGRAYVIPPSGDKGHRLVVELKGFLNASQHADAGRATQIFNPGPAVSGSTVAPADSVAVSPATPSPPPRQIKKEVVMSESLRDVVVAIDAGHGGVDPGAQGYRGTYEKDVVLGIARKLAQLVDGEEGMRPVMIRDGDQFISLRDRIDRARAHKADLFISIHADAFPDRQAKGASVYALSRNGATTEAARLLADRENASDLIGGVSLDDKDKMLASVLLDLSQSATIEASLDVAGRVLKGLKKVGTVHKNHVEQAGFAVLKSPDIPSILVETAFISNPAEERNLTSQHYQQKLAEAIIQGIRSYFVANPPQGTHIAAHEHIIRRGETLSDIASQYNIPAQTLRVANDLDGDRLRVGQVLRIPVSGS